MASASSIAPWLALLIGTVVLGFGGPVAWKAADAELLARRAATWPTSPARIEPAEIRERVGRRGGRFYRVEVRYRRRANMRHRKSPLNAGQSFRIAAVRKAAATEE